MRYLTAVTPVTTMRGHARNQPFCDRYHIVTASPRYGHIGLNGLTGEWHACFLFVSGSTRGETGISVVLAEPTRNAEDEIAEYLERDQHDLPPALRIELERRSMSP